MADRRVFAGLEGGATHTALCIYDESGTKMGDAKGTGTNYYTNGIESVVSTIMSLVAEARRKAGLTDADTFAAMGFCMAGFAEPKAQAHLITTLTERHPSLSRAYKVVNDSVGSVYSASANGGVCVIAGTGSIANLITAKGNDFRSGGWGHMIGDEGSAYYISTKAVRLMLNATDGHRTSLPDTSRALATILRFFDVPDRNGLLDVFYGERFSKSAVAALCKELAADAAAGDAFCQLLFRKAGLHLGRAVRATVRRAPKLERSAATPDDPIQVVAVGSVWKSYALLKDGFVSGLCGPEEDGSPSPVQAFSLVRLLGSAAPGAAFLAARDVGATITIDYDSMVEQLDRGSAFDLPATAAAARAGRAVHVATAAVVALGVIAAAVFLRRR